jgi:hypothetical protein
MTEPEPCKYDTYPNPAREWTRYDGQNCDYLNYYSSYDIQMRRKAEILKYNNNTSTLTKKQQWAQINKGKTKKNSKTSWAVQNHNITNPNIDNLTLYNNILYVCDDSYNTKSTSFSTSASNVPSSSNTNKLYLDTSIPLINYKIQNKFMSGGNKWPTTSWKPGMSGFPVGKKGSN